MTASRPVLETLDDVIRHHAQTRPDATAIVFEGTRLSYGELDRRASGVAQALIAAGIGPGDRVAHLGRNTAAYFELLAGIARARAVIVGINWRLSPEEVAYILDDSEARLLFADDDLADLAKGSTLAGAETLIRLDDPGFAAWRDSAPADDPGLEPRSDEVLFQMYTSGTTGHPKGAEITHYGVIGPRWREDEIPDAEWETLTDDAVQLVQAPVFHLTGNAWACIGLYAGATLVVHRDFDPGRILRDIEQERITHAIFVPAMFLALLQHPELGTVDLSSLRRVYYGAAPAPLDLICRAMQALGCDFVQVYGMTEIGGSGTYLPPADHDPEGRSPRMRSVGKPYPWVEIRILDPDGRDLPPGEIGEVALRTDMLMTGYWKRPEATADRIRDGWFLTGDAGSLDAEGYLYIHDRVDDMIISGGENIYPAEVENCLFSHPGVADAAVVGAPSERWGETVRAFVVRRPGDDATADDIIAHARAHIAHYKCPSEVVFVDALPRNAAGKVLRRELRQTV